jgi:hypothetical protein
MDGQAHLGAGIRRTRSGLYEPEVPMRICGQVRCRTSRGSGRCCEGQAEHEAVEVFGGDVEGGGYVGWGGALGAEVLPDFGEELGGFAGEAVGFGAAVAAAAEFDAGVAVLPVGEEAQVVEAVGEG